MDYLGSVEGYMCPHLPKCMIYTPKSKAQEEKKSEI